MSFVRNGKPGRQVRFTSVAFHNSDRPLTTDIGCQTGERNSLLDTEETDCITFQTPVTAVVEVHRATLRTTTAPVVEGRGVPATVVQVQQKAAVQTPAAEDGNAKPVAKQQHADGEENVDGAAVQVPPPEGRAVAKDADQQQKQTSVAGNAAAAAAVVDQQPEGGDTIIRVADTDVDGKPAAANSLPPPEAANTDGDNGCFSFNCLFLACIDCCGSHVM